MNIKKEKTIHFDEHEIYMSFNSDDEAQAFSEWWHDVSGEQDFYNFYEDYFKKQ